MLRHRHFLALLLNGLKIDTMQRIITTKVNLAELIQICVPFQFQVKSTGFSRDVHSDEWIDNCHFGSCGVARL